LPCCVAVAVSVLMVLGWRAKEALEATLGAVRADKMEDAGRANRETERRNTMVYVLK
jgi:hypothetical protein